MSKRPDITDSRLASSKATTSISFAIEKDFVGADATLQTPLPRQRVTAIPLATPHGLRHSNPDLGPSRRERPQLDLLLPAQELAQTITSHLRDFGPFSAASAVKATS
jgi:hypothetical protein